MKLKDTFTTIKPEICLGLLFQSRDIVHLTHLQTTSLAEHKALNKLYEGLLDLTDELIETYFGTIGKRLNVKIPASEYMNAKAHCIFMKDYIMQHRGIFGKENTHIQNILDEIIALYTKTLYLLSLT
jgi:hypothetical protein